MVLVSAGTKQRDHYGPGAANDDIMRIRKADSAHRVQRANWRNRSVEQPAHGADGHALKGLERFRAYDGNLRRIRKRSAGCCSRISDYYSQIQQKLEHSLWMICLQASNPQDSPSRLQLILISRSASPFHKFSLNISFLLSLPRLISSELLRHIRSTRLLLHVCVSPPR